MELLSEIGKNVEWKKPETMLVIKRKNISYNSYFNAKTNSWGGLLDATIYTDNEVPNVQDGEIIDYRKLIGTK